MKVRIPQLDVYGTLMGEWGDYCWILIDTASIPTTFPASCVEKLEQKQNGETQ